MFLTATGEGFFLRIGVSGQHGRRSGCVYSSGDQQGRAGENQPWYTTLTMVQTYLVQSL